MSRCPLALLFLALAAPSAAEVTAVSPETVARGAYPDLAAGPGGALHLVYVRGDELYYRLRRSGGWSAEEATGLPAGMVERSDPEVVVDSGGRPHALVGSTYAWRDESGEWHRVDPDVTRDTALAIDSGDNVYVVRRGGHQGGWLGAAKRPAGADRFQPLDDPDTATGLPSNYNDHVYAHVFVSPLDDSVHVVYRHARPLKLSYRVSTDGGRTWAAGGIADDDREAPSGTVAPDGSALVVSGRGNVYRRDGGPGDWSLLGRAFETERRDLPVVAADSRGSFYVAAFGGKTNAWSGGAWAGEGTLPGDSSLGYVDLTVTAEDKVWAAWEAGPEVSREERAGTSDIRVARLETPLAVSEVGRYERFEDVIRNPLPYADPYQDVTLETRFVSPSGEETSFWGFYDGGGTWRFRFLPSELGEWRYEAKFSDGSGATSGSFRCVESDTPGLIAADPANPRWFGYSSGEPLLVRALHIGDPFFASNWPRENRAVFLDWIDEHDYNTLSLASHYLNRDQPGRGRGWETPDLWPLDAAEYRQMEAILDELARRRIHVFPFAGFFGQRADYPRDRRDQELYLRYTIARLGAYWNLLWNVAGPEPNLRDSWMASDEVERLGRQIAELDPFGHLLAVHNRTGDDPYRDSDWTTYGVLQGPKTVDAMELGHGLLDNHHPEKPLLAQETLWSGNMYHVRRHGGYSDDVLRRNAWAIQMAAAALVFADNNGNSSSGFSGHMRLADARESRHAIVGRVWDFMETIPFRELSPHPELVDRGLCLAKPGERYLVYLPEGGAVSVEIDGEVDRAEWINSRDTADRRPIEASGSRFTVPNGEDWLLSITIR